MGLVFPFLQYPIQTTWLPCPIEVTPEFVHQADDQKTISFLAVEKILEETLFQIPSTVLLRLGANILDYFSSLPYPWF